jgi:hypothetical protein
MILLIKVLMEFREQFPQHATSRRMNAWAFYDSVASTRQAVSGSIWWFIAKLGSEPGRITSMTAGITMVRASKQLRNKMHGILHSSREGWSIKLYEGSDTSAESRGINCLHDRRKDSSLQAALSKPMHALEQSSGTEREIMQGVVNDKL